jgi:hypothetical protein
MTVAAGVGTGEGFELWTHPPIRTARMSVREIRRRKASFMARNTHQRILTFFSVTFQMLTVVAIKQTQEKIGRDSCFKKTRCT